MRLVKVDLLNRTNFRKVKSHDVICWTWKPWRSVHKKST